MGVYLKTLHNKIMGFLKRIKELRVERENRHIKERADVIFQITEYNGELWFTYDTFLYCPCSMMADDPIVSLNILRQGYIERNSK